MPDLDDRVWWDGEESKMDELKIGECYLFHGRMVYLGEVVRYDLLDIVIRRASWMGWMGVRMGELMKHGPAAYTRETEIEVMPPDMEVPIPRGAVARFPWPFDLPEKSI